MNFTGVYHKTSEQMSYPKNEKELIINLKTGYDVKRVFIHYGDRLKQVFLAEMRDGLGNERKSAIRNG